MTAERQQAPRYIWLMGLANMTYGYGYAAVLVTLPQLLAARGVAEPRIANIVAVAMAIALLTFVLAPLLDCWMSRRAWAITLALLSFGQIFFALLLPASSLWFAILLPGGALALSLYNTAIGGWLGSVLPKDCDETIGAWFNIGNSAGFGCGAQVQFWLVTHLPGGTGAALASAGILLPLAILAAIPAPDSTRAAVHENFRRLGRDVGQLLRQPPVVRILVLFVLPCGAFTLTNAFGAMGRAFNANATTIDTATGIASIVISLIAALAFKPLLARIRAPLAYLAVGSLGGIFTLALLPLPHVAPVFVLAVLGENVAQTCAQVAQNTIVFRSIPLGSPLAATQFGLLQTAAVVPYSYMQALDGVGYGRAGIAGAFLTDAGVSIAACALVLLPLLRWLRAGALDAAPAASPALASPA